MQLRYYFILIDLTDKCQLIINCDYQLCFMILNCITINLYWNKTLNRSLIIKHIYIWVSVYMHAHVVRGLVQSVVSISYVLWDVAVY